MLRFYREINTYKSSKCIQWQGIMHAKLDYFDRVARSLQAESRESLLGLFWFGVCIDRCGVPEYTGHGDRHLCPTVMAYASGYSFILALDQYSHKILVGEHVDTLVGTDRYCLCKLSYDIISCKSFRNKCFALLISLLLA